MDINSNIEDKTNKIRCKWYYNTLEDIWLEELLQLREVLPFERHIKKYKQHEQGYCCLFHTILYL